jgi:ubiquinone/menaquinone biosynthesis C-methylase UbiE
MTTDYNAIVDGYQESKLAPWRTYSEQYSLLKWLGDLAGHSVLDLACGQGYYTRRYAQHGAGPVVGVDMASEMIRTARQQEARQPLGIEYVVSDAESLELGRTFDVVAAAYLLNYAQSREQLLAMCRSFARHLRPGGRFVTVNGSSDFPPERGELLSKYLLVRKMDGPKEDGTPIWWTFLLEGGRSVTIENYYLSRATHQWAFREAGLVNLRWHKVDLDPVEEARSGREFWSDFVEAPPMVVLMAEKPA